MKPLLDFSENLKLFFSFGGLISFSLLSCQRVESWRSDRANLSSDLIGRGQEAAKDAPLAAATRRAVVSATCCCSRKAGG